MKKKKIWKGTKWQKLCIKKAQNDKTNAFIAKSLYIFFFWGTQFYFTLLNLQTNMLFICIRVGINKRGVGCHVMIKLKKCGLK